MPVVLRRSATRYPRDSPVGRRGFSGEQMMRRLGVPRIKVEIAVVLALCVVAGIMALS